MKELLILTTIIVSLVILLYILTTFDLSYSKNTLGKYTNGYKRGSDGIENFLNPAPINNRINNNDGKYLNNCPHSLWRHPPAHESLKVGKNYTPLGVQLPLIPKESINVSNGPSVNGKKKGPKNMFMFAFNQCKPECCPSTYSCSGGCVCTTKNQRDYLKNRGNNKTFANGQI